MYTPFDNLSDAEFVRYLETRTEMSPDLTESIRKRLAETSDLIAEARDAGYDKGHEDGYREGYNDGQSDS